MRKHDDMTVPVIAILAQYPDGMRESATRASELEAKIWWDMKCLCQAAGARTLADLEDWERAMFTISNLNASIVPVIPDYFLTKWRKVSRAKLLELEPTTMRATDIKLKEEWSARLTRILLAYADEMPEVSKRLVYEDPIREISDLFGKNRWGGLRAHVNNIEKALKVMPSILVATPDKCWGLAGILEGLGVAASTPRRIIKSLDWLAERTGTEKVLTGPVEQKVAAVKNRLVRVLTATPRRAEAPPRDVLAALEVT